jgi:hypothetical protein
MSLRLYRNQLSGRSAPDLPLLLSYPGANAAYSLRDLTGSNQDLIVVRRTSDDAETSFNEQEITDGSLETWCGASDGHVVSWIDQTGSSADLSQAILSRQPKIVSLGSLLTENNKPSILFDGTHFLAHDTPGNWQSAFIAANYTEANVFGNYNGIISNTLASGSNSGIGFMGSQGQPYFYSTSWYDQRYLNSSLYVYPTSVFPVLSSLAVVSGVSTDTIVSSGLCVGADRAIINRLWVGFISEVLLYPSDKSADRQDIESNLGTYYGIF